MVFGLRMDVSCQEKKCQRFAGTLIVGGIVIYTTITGTEIGHLAEQQYTRRTLKGKKNE